MSSLLYARWATVTSTAAADVVQAEQIKKLHMTEAEKKLAAIVALVAPPVVTYLISSQMKQSGLDILSILVIEGLGFSAAVVLLRPRAWNAVLGGLLYFTATSILILWIGHRAGYYVTSGQ